MAIFYNNGCFLPFLIIFNLFFGRLFFSLRLWLAIEGVLIIFFIILSYLSGKRIMKSFQKRNNVIDIEGEVIEDKEKLK